MKEPRAEAAARPSAGNPKVPDNLEDMKNLVKELWSENLSLISEVRKLRYAIAELKYDNAMLKTEARAKEK